MPDSFSASLPPGGLNPVYRAAPRAATTDSVGRVTTANPEALRWAAGFQQVTRNIGSAHLDAFPSRSHVLMAHLQGQGNSNSSNSSQVKQCKKCKHTYPIEHYQFKDNFSRSKERVNCQTCRTKRRASDKARMTREKDAEQAERQQQLQNQGQLLHGNNSSIAGSLQPLDIQGSLSADPTQQPIQGLNTIALRDLMPAGWRRMAVHSHQPVSGQSSSEQPRPILPASRRAPSYIAASRTVGTRLPGQMPSAKVFHNMPMYQGPLKTSHAVSKPINFKAQSRMMPGLQPSMGNAGPGLTTPPGSANTTGTCPAALPLSSSVQNPAELSSPFLLNPASAFGGTTLSDLCVVDTGEASSMTGLDEMCMEWYQEANAELLDSPALADGSTQAHGYLDELSQAQGMSPMEQFTPPMCEQSQYLSPQPQLLSPTTCLAHEIHHEAEVGEEETESEDEDQAHSLPMVPAAQLAKMSPLERQTRERWELGLKKCMQLRAMDAQTLDCLWLERQSAAQAGVEICPHTTDTPEELWQIPIDTPLLYPESHMSIARALQRGTDDDDE